MTGACFTTAPFVGDDLTNSAWPHADPNGASANETAATQPTSAAETHFKGRHLRAVAIPVACGFWVAQLLV